MWRNQSYNTSSDSMLDLGKTKTSAHTLNSSARRFLIKFFPQDTDKMRGQSFCRPMESWKPPYVGRCVGECDVIPCHLVTSLRSLIINLPSRFRNASIIIRCLTSVPTTRPWTAKCQRKTCQLRPICLIHITRPHSGWIRMIRKSITNQVSCLCNFSRRFCF